MNIYLIYGSVIIGILTNSYIINNHIIQSPFSRRHFSESVYERLI